MSVDFKMHTDKFMDKMETKIFEKIKKLGLKVESNAKHFAPVDTGRLRASITSVASDGPLSQMGSAASATELKSKRTKRNIKGKPAQQLSLPKSRMTVKVGTNVQYAGHVEYGTSKMAAHPFLRPAFHDAIHGSEFFKVSK